MDEKAISIEELLEDNYKKISSKLTDFNKESVLKIFETLSKELNLSDLLLKLIIILMDNTGAKRCRLILEEKNKLVARAICCIETDINSIIKEPISSSENYPIELINEAYKNKKMIILDNASQSHYKNEEYIIINKSLSLLLYPITTNRNHEVILFLENDIQTSVFNKRSLRSLDILSSQIAISIDNAILFRTLEYKIEQYLKDLRDTQNQLIQAEKMSSLGVLTAGIAHEMNTPLAYVKNNFQLVNRMVNKQKSIHDDTITKLLSDCETGINKVSDIVSGLKNYSRKDDDLTQFVYIHEIIDQSLLICQSLFKTNRVNIDTKLDKHVQLDCYPAQLEQVFINLINNSNQAIQNKKSIKNGLISIRLQKRKKKCNY